MTLLIDSTVGLLCLVLLPLMKPRPQEAPAPLPSATASPLVVAA